VTNGYVKGEEKRETQRMITAPVKKLQRGEIPSGGVLAQFWGRKKGERREFGEGKRSTS